MSICTSISVPFQRRLVPSRYLRVLWGEKIGYEDGLRRAECHGKRQRKNSDWQISFDRSVQSCVEPCSALFQENGVI